VTGILKHQKREGTSDEGIKNQCCRHEPPGILIAVSEFDDIIPHFMQGFLHCSLQNYEQIITVHYIKCKGTPIHILLMYNMRSLFLYHNILLYQITFRYICMQTVSVSFLHTPYSFTVQHSWPRSVQSVCICVCVCAHACTNCKHKISKSSTNKECVRQRVPECSSLGQQFFKCDMRTATEECNIMLYSVHQHNHFII